MPLVPQTTPMFNDNGTLSRTWILFFQDLLKNFGSAVNVPAWISVKDPSYGAVGDGATDDTEAILAATADATAAGKPVYFPNGSYILKKSVVIDVAKTRWVGDSATILPTGSGFTTYGSNPYPHVLHVDGSADYFGSATVPNARQNNRCVLEGINLVAGSLGHPVALTAILFEGTLGYFDSLFSMDYVSIDSFQEPMRFGDNTWAFSAAHLYIRNGKIISPSASSNFGERMVIRDSFLADGLTIQLTKGEWHFIGVSIDNTQVIIDGDAQAFFTDTHWENPGNAASFRYLSLTHKEAMAVITNSFLLVNPPSGGVPFTMAPFYCDDVCTNKGLTIRDCWFSAAGGIFQTETTELNRLWVGGKGKVQISGYQSWALPSFHGAYAIARGANQFRNGDFEEGTTAGWQSNPYAGTSTFTADAAIKKVGSYSGKTTAAVSSGINVWQTFRITPGQWLNYSFWLKVTTTGTGQFAVYIEWLDSSGAVVTGTVGYQFWHGTLDWFLVPVYEIAPVGAATGRITFQTYGGTGAAECYIDDVVVNPS